MQIITNCMSIKKYALITVSYLALATAPFWAPALRNMSEEYQKKNGYFLPKVEVEKGRWSETIRRDFDHDGVMDETSLRMPFCPIEISMDKKTIESKLSE
jgi:hypothetical protein